MSKYVDIDDLAERVDKLFARLPENKVINRDGSSYLFEIAKEHLSINLVHCKDCKFRNATPGQPNILCYNMKDDDFCSYGEKKEE